MLPFNLFYLSKREAAILCQEPVRATANFILIATSIIKADNAINNNPG
jgi:hypothetical protein